MLAPGTSSRNSVLCSLGDQTPFEMGNRSEDVRVFDQIQAALDADDPPVEIIETLIDAGQFALETGKNDIRARIRA